MFKVTVPRHVRHPGSGDADDAQLEKLCPWTKMVPVSSEGAVGVVQPVAARRHSQTTDRVSTGAPGLRPQWNG